MHDILLMEMLEFYTDVSEHLSNHRLAELDVQLLNVSQVTRTILHLAII